jgi:quercetin 2,3-dioxygenase
VHAIPRAQTAFVVVAQGGLDVSPGSGGRPLTDGQLGVLGAGDAIDVVATHPATRVLVFAGTPIGEPVARRGPFVMNTDEELRQAYDDYRSGRLVGG